MHSLRKNGRMMGVYKASDLEQDAAPKGNISLDLVTLCEKQAKEEEKCYLTTGVELLGTAAASKTCSFVF
jgi:hypothetical protein